MTRRPIFADLSTISMRVTLLASPVAAHLASYSHWDYLEIHLRLKITLSLSEVCCVQSSLLEFSVKLSFTDN